jgi:hypothetical protein
MSFDAHPPRPIALSADLLANKTWSAPSDLGFVQSLTEVQIGANEAARVGRSYGWYFKRDDAGWALVVALTDEVRKQMCSLERQESALGLPFLLRLYPFTLLRQKGRLCLAVWNTMLRQADQGQSFFEGKKLTPPVAKVSEHFTSFGADLGLASRLARALEAAELLVPAAQSQLGYYEVDETKLMSLSEQTIVNLHKIGALGLAYSQLFSLHSKAVAKSQSTQAARPETFGQSDSFLSSIAQDIEADIPALEVDFEG